jgi:FtsZ-interacting cell division protein ZipA
MSDVFFLLCAIGLVAIIARGFWRSTRIARREGSSVEQQPPISNPGADSIS